MLSGEAVGRGSAPGETCEQKTGIPGSCGQQAHALCSNAFHIGSESEPMVICHEADFAPEQRSAFGDDRETAGGFLNRPGELGACT